MSAQAEASYRKHWRHMSNYAYQVLEQSQDAEDAAQEVFVRWLESGEHLNNPPAWLFRSLRRLCIDEIRRRKVRRKHTSSVEESDALRVTPGPDLIAETDLRREVLSLLARLSNRQRECLALKVSGYKHDEIADMLGISPVRVRVYWHDARERLSAIRGWERD